MLNTVVYRIVMGLAILGIYLPCSAQNTTPHKRYTAIINVPMGNLVNLRAYVMKGDIVRLQGKLDDSLDETALALRARNSVLASGSFTKQWHLDWDSASDDDPSPNFWIYLAHHNGVGVAIAHVFVTVYTKSPIQVTVNAPTSPEKDPLVVKVACDDQELRPVKYTVLLDGKPVEAAFENGQATISMKAQPTGKRQISVMAMLLSRATLTSPSQEIDLPHRIELLPLATGSLLYEGKFPLKTKRDADIKPKSIEFYVDGAMIDKTEVPPFTDVLLDTTRMKIGEHALFAVVTQADGSAYASPQIVFTTASNPALHEDDPEKPGLPTTSEKDTWVAWRDTITTYITKLQRSMGEVNKVLSTRYEGTEQCSRSIEDMKREIVFPRAAKTKLGQLEVPKSMSAEDKRTAYKLLKELAQANAMTEDAIQTLWTQLVVLSKHDGNPDDTPAFERNLVDTGFSRAYVDMAMPDTTNYRPPSFSGKLGEALAQIRRSGQTINVPIGAVELAKQAAYNLDLIARRSGSNGN